MCTHINIKLCSVSECTQFPIDHHGVVDRDTGAMVCV